MTMDIIYVVGILGCSVVGLFVQPTWKRFLAIGLILFLAFDLPGFVLFVAGSLISYVDDYYMSHPYLEIPPIIWGKVSESLVVTLVLIEVVLTIISLIYKTIQLFT